MDREASRSPHGASPPQQPPEERLEEFHFLFAQDRLALAAGARANHPPREALQEYARGNRTLGVDPQEWGRQAISVHVALCTTCTRRLRRIRRYERLRSLAASPFRRGGPHVRLQDSPRWRRAFQYATLILLIGGLFLGYSLWQGTQVDSPRSDPPPPPSPEYTGNRPGMS